MAARKFLYVVAALIVLTLGSAFAYRMWGQQMLGAVMVPSARFSEPNRLTATDYADRKLWLARPDISATNDSTWLPQGVKRTEPGPAAVFYVHPTSYMAPFNIARWNASLEDEESQETARRFVMTQASAFTTAGQIWAPRYHQAHFGAFLSRSEDATSAINAAYREVVAAFKVFLTENPAGPVILAGHSQGAMHLLRLMKNEVAGKEVAGRIVAAYLVGWPVSLTADIPALGLPACERADQAGCVLSWQSFAEPANPAAVLGAYGHYRGMTGKQRDGTPMLCINPLTGMQGNAAPAKANLGTLGPSIQLDGRDARLIKGAVSARCGTEGKEAGFLLVGTPPQLGPYVLPGNNYHVYDYALFWANIRADATKRLTTFLAQ
ncbi:MAG: DUF3089 domain-containing protein [Sphingomonadales bacterium]|nr:MAG: DUF3089 domain-containing protein [Sphingomonadales bacterium]TNF02102.1 MAG: DUF3089 domain-containing protein [Sphingomonadales bacterium]